MSIVTVAELKKYATLSDEDATGEALYQSYLDAAEARVVDFLTYNPTSATLTQTYYGDGTAYLALRSQPITALTAITVGGVSQNVSDFTYDRETITNKYGTPFPAGAVVVVTYTAGYATVPGVFKVTILEIATLLASERGENIGATSKTFDGGNTRTFVNYTNFDKYLAKLEPYRIRALRRLAP
jgi:hypothetical protein